MGCGMVPVEDRRALEPASPGAAPAPGWRAFLLAARMTERWYPGAPAFLLGTPAHRRHPRRPFSYPGPCVWAQAAAYGILCCWPPVGDGLGRECSG